MHNKSSNRLRCAATAVIDSVKVARDYGIPIISDAVSATLGTLPRHLCRCIVSNDRKSIWWNR